MKLCCDSNYSCTALKDNQKLTKANHDMIELVIELKKEITKLQKKSRTAYWRGARHASDIAIEQSNLIQPSDDLGNMLLQWRLGFQDILDLQVPEPKE